jgi:hypothetical protein
MISVEICNEGPRVVIVTRRGDRIGTDRKNERKKMEQWVKTLVGPIPAFDPQQEKETYQREKKELIIMNWGASTSVTPPKEYRSMLENPTGKVSTLIELLRNCVEIIKYEVAMSKLYDTQECLYNGLIVAY